MTSCCTTPDTPPPTRAACPRNGKWYNSVSRRTLQHQLRKPWQLVLPEQGYYFCDDPHCDVVYFGEEQSLILTTGLRNPVGQKSTTDQRTLCYCFDIDTLDIATSEAHEDARAFVIAQTRNGQCDCETRNPSGRCCLKDFPRPTERH